MTLYKTDIYQSPLLETFTPIWDYRGYYGQRFALVKFAGEWQLS